MSDNLDFTLVVTTQDIIKMKDKIRMTKRKLVDAVCTRTRVAKIERELELMRAWIKPVRRLNADVLFIIFEICGEDDWKTPLRIAATCRQWRNLVLATPRAWQFLHLAEFSYVETAELYLERSHPRLLHLYVPDTHAGPLLSGISQRLECLTLDYFHTYMTRLSFPNLKRLEMAGRCDLPMSWIDTTRFPTLRHLICSHYITPLFDDDPLNFPPLQSLVITLDIDRGLLRVLQACQDTLISLKVTVRHSSTDIQKCQFVFPRLIFLDMEDWGKQSGGPPLDLKTPVLETHIERHLSGLISLDTKMATQLRMTRKPESFKFPRVRLLQFYGEKYARPLLDDLSSDPTHFPELEIIEVEMSGEAPNDMVELVKTVNTKRKRAISLVYVRELRNLHGMVKPQFCGPDMPCYRR